MMDPELLAELAAVTGGAMPAPAAPSRHELEQRVAAAKAEAAHVCTSLFLLNYKINLFIVFRLCFHLFSIFKCVSSWLHLMHN